jgi:hypothetical protein
MGLPTFCHFGQINLTDGIGFRCVDSVVTQILELFVGDDDDGTAFYGVPCFPVRKHYDGVSGIGHVMIVPCVRGKEKRKTKISSHISDEKYLSQTKLVPLPSLGQRESHEFMYSLKGATVQFFKTIRAASQLPQSVVQFATCEKESKLGLK